MNADEAISARAEPTAPETATPSLIWSQNFESFSIGETWSELDNSSHSSVEIVDNCRSQGNQCLRTTYRPNHRGSRPIVGKIPLASGTHYRLEYDILFEGDFEFVNGGKLPGFSPETHITGCQDNTPGGWSARLMWYGNQGQAMAYDYNQDRTEPCGEGQLSGNNVFRANQWQRIALEVKLNDGADDYSGEVRLFVDGQLVSSHNGLRMRTVNTDASSIRYFYFSTFYGGSDPSWAPSRTNYIQFDNFRVTNLD